MAAAGALLLLETFIIRGPLRAGIVRTFLGKEVQLSGKKASRLVSQLAARLIGCLFLIIMVRKEAPRLSWPESYLW